MATGAQAPRAASGAPGWRAWAAPAALAAIVAVSAALMLYRIADPIRGYHAYNEGFYSDLGLRYLGQGLLAPFTSPFDFNNPPLYPLLVTSAFRLFGPSVAAARLVSVLASLATVLLVYALGKRLYNERVALFAAAITGAMPGFVLAGRNAQTDALATALMLGAVLCYVRAVPNDDRRSAILGGVLLGLALLTKLPAILVVPGVALWETLRTRGWRWILARRVRWSAAPAALAASLWYVAQPLFNPAYLASQGQLAATRLMPDWPFFVLTAAEVTSAFSLIVALGAVAAIALMLVRRQPADLLVLSLFGVQAVFYLFYHFHTYYLLPMMPLAALAVARGLAAAGVTSLRRVAAVAVPLVLVLALSSVVTLAAKKYSDWPLADIGSSLREFGTDPAAVSILVDRGAWDNTFAPIVRFYGRKLEVRGFTVIDDPAKVKPTRDGSQLILSFTGQNQLGTGVLRRIVYRPVLFGLALRAPDPYLNLFKTGWWQVQPVGPPWRFGWDETAEASDYTLYLP